MSPLPSAFTFSKDLSKTTFANGLTYIVRACDAADVGTPVPSAAIVLMPQNFGMPLRSISGVRSPKTSVRDAVVVEFALSVNS